MTTDDKDKNVVAEALSLLELALSVGRLAKHGLEDRCRKFLHLLMSRRDLSFAAIWVRSSSLERGGRSDQFEILSALPSGRSTKYLLDDDEPIFGVFKDKPWLGVNYKDSDFSRHVPELDVTRGMIATFRLGEFGVLRLFSENDTSFAQESLARDYSVIEAFATSVDAGLNERLLKAEIEERHRIERQLLQSQKMEMIGQLAATVSHDFNNLLAVMQGTLDIQVLKNGDSLVGMKTMQEAIERGAKLTGHLLNYSRSETTHEPRTSCMESILRDVLPLIKQAVGQAIQLETNLDCAGHVVLTDPGFAKDAFLNIALNARDAMPNGGEFRIEAILKRGGGVTFGGACASDAFIEVSFTDTGNGMDKKTAARASERFFTTKPMGTGTGIGLANARELVEKSGGTLNIESALGVGTTVSLNFPASIGDSDDTQTDVSKEVDAIIRSLNILIVEDSELYRDIISQQIELLGHNFVAASDATEGFEIFRMCGDFDLVLSDIVLPNGYSGLELARDILRHKSDQKIAFMTGYSPKTKDEILEDFPDSKLFYKPIKFETLAELLDNFVKKCEQPQFRNGPKLS